MSESIVQYPLDKGTMYGIMYAALVVCAVMALLTSYAIKRRGGDKDQTYLSARGEFRWPALALSYFATVMGAWILYSPAEVGTFLGWWGVIGYALSSAIPSWFFMYVGPLIRDKVKSGFCLTDWVLYRYGRPVQVYVALFAAFYMWIVLVADYTAVGQVINSFSGIPVWLTNLSVAVFTLGYTLTAGLPASIFTDTLQGVGVAILMLVAVIVASTELDVSSDDWKSVTTWTGSGFRGLVALTLAILPAGLLDMAQWQRVWAAERPRDVRLGLFVASIATFVAVFVFGVMGMLAEAQDRGREEPELTLKFLAFFTLLTPLGAGWTACVAAMAVALVASTVDSMQNGIVSVLSTDILRYAHSQTPQTGILGYMRKHPLAVARLAVVLINIPAVILAMDEISVLEIFLMADLFVATVFVPVFMGLFVKKVTSLSCLLGCISGLLTVLVWGWADFRTFKGGFEMLKLPNGLYDTRTMEVFIAVPCVTFGVTSVTAFVQHAFLPSTIDFASYGVGILLDTTTVEDEATAEKANRDAL